MIHDSHQVPPVEPSALRSKTQNSSSFTSHYSMTNPNHSLKSKDRLNLNVDMQSSNRSTALQSLGCLRALFSAQSQVAYLSTTKHHLRRCGSRKSVSLSTRSDQNHSKSPGSRLMFRGRNATTLKGLPVAKRHMSTTARILLQSGGSGLVAHQSICD